jgi:hypothetical protein
LIKIQGSQLTNQEASCIGQSSYATLIANGNGYAEVNGGSNNQVIVSQLGSGLVRTRLCSMNSADTVQVGGSENTGVVSIGGNLRVVNTGRANVEPGGIATVYGYVSQVTVSASATATMCTSHFPDLASFSLTTQSQEQQ